MAVTPEFALSRSPAAVFTDEEAKDAAEYEQRIDAALCGVPDGPVDPAKPRGWRGGLWAYDFQGILPEKMVAHLVRVYRRAGWMPKFEAVPSNVKAPNGQVAIAGLRLVLEPMWERTASRDVPTLEIVHTASLSPEDMAGLVRDVARANGTPGTAPPSRLALVENADGSPAEVAP